MNRRWFLGASLAAVGSVFVPKYGSWYRPPVRCDDTPALLRRLQRGEVVTGESFQIGSSLWLPPTNCVLTHCQLTGAPHLKGPVVVIPVESWGRSTFSYNIVSWGGGLGLYTA